jgi:transcription initiation factor TFIID TATA-box-binding protein
MTEILKHKKAQVEIENVVATADLNQHLDLEAILQATPGTRYNPERFPGLVYKLKKPATTTLLFASGKMVCTGARSTRSAKAAIAQIISNLMNCGIVILARPEVEIENIVASGNLDGSIDLENVAERLFNTMYEPEQFPAIIYRMTEPKAVFLIFTSGRIVCTAAKTETEVHLAVERLRNTLEMNGLITCERASNNEEKQLLAAIPP